MTPLSTEWCASPTRIVKLCLYRTRTWRSSEREDMSVEAEARWDICSFWTNLPLVSVVQSGIHGAGSVSLSTRVHCPAATTTTTLHYHPPRSWKYDDDRCCRRVMRRPARAHHVDVSHVSTPAHRASTPNESKSILYLMMMTADSTTTMAHAWKLCAAPVLSYLHIAAVEREYINAPSAGPDDVESGSERLTDGEMDGHDDDDVVVEWNSWRGCTSESASVGESVGDDERAGGGGWRWSSGGCRGSSATRNINSPL